MANSRPNMFLARGGSRQIMLCQETEERVTEEATSASSSDKTNHWSQPILVCASERGLF